MLSTLQHLNKFVGELFLYTKMVKDSVVSIESINLFCSVFRFGFIPQYVAAHIKLLDFHIGRLARDTFSKGNHRGLLMLC